MKGWLITAACAIVLIVGAQFISIFVAQPIGALPDGRTVIIFRKPFMGAKGLAFIDSADAWCERNSGGVSLLCRGAALGGIGKGASIIARLPYSSLLYSISTGGKTYGR